MIEIYSKNLDGTHFAVALSQGEIVTSTFSSEQKTALKRILANLPFNEPFQIFHEPINLAKNLLAAIRDVYLGKDADIKFILAKKELPTYTQKVLCATVAIPVGYVTSYGAIAEAVGGGARAVGNAMAFNKFQPIVPCHRVVKSDFGIGGYSAGGLRVKMDFLQREKKGFTEPKEIDVDSGCLRVFPVENVLKKYT